MEQAPFSVSNRSLEHIKPNLYQIIFESIRDIIIITDEDNKILYANPLFTEKLGYETKDYLNKKGYDFFHPDDVYLIKDASKLSKKHYKEEKIQARVRHANGEFLWLEIIASPIINSDGSSFFVSSCRDVTDRVEVEEQFKYTQKKINEIFSYLDKVYWSIDFHSLKVDMISPSCERIFGISPTEFMENEIYHWRKFIHPEDVLFVISNLEKLKLGEPIEFEYRVIHSKTKDIHWVLTRAFPKTDDNGEIETLSGLITDITEKKKVEEQLQLSGKIFQSATEGIMVTDLRGKIIMINPSFTKITGYNDEVIGMTPKILSSGKHDKSFYKKIWDSIETTGLWKGEIWNKRKNGKLYLQSMTITVIHNDTGDPFCYASIFFDITKQKEDEAQLQADLRIAKNIQKNVLSKPMSTNSFTINGLYEPSTGLAGDMYAWSKIDEHRYGVIIIDIMGHGVSSSLVTMYILSLIKEFIPKYTYPGKIMKELNHHMRTLYQHDRGTMPYYFTGICLVIDIEKGEVQYASAGHPSGLIIDKNNGGKIIEMLSTGVPVGILSEPNITNETVKIKGDFDILLYTDGLLDLCGQSTKKSIELLKERILSEPTFYSQEGLELLYKSLIDTRSTDDDVTMVGISVKV